MNGPLSRIERCDCHRMARIENVYRTHSYLSVQILLSQDLLTVISTIDHGCLRRYSRTFRNLFFLRKSISQWWCTGTSSPTVRTGAGHGRSLFRFSKVEQSILSVPEASVLAASLNLTIGFESCVYDLLSFCITLEKVCSSCNLIRVVNKTEWERERKKEATARQGSSLWTYFNEDECDPRVISPDLTNDIVTSMTRSPFCDIQRRDFLSSVWFIQFVILFHQSVILHKNK